MLRVQEVMTLLARGLADQGFSEIDIFMALSLFAVHARLKWGIPFTPEELHRIARKALEGVPQKGEDPTIGDFSGLEGELPALDDEDCEYLALKRVRTE
jgi:hypothetical protein